MEPTLVLELVDRTDPKRPVVLARRAVLVEVPRGEPGRGWTVPATAVLGGYRLGLGDVVVASCVGGDWLAEVVEELPGTWFRLVPLARTSWGRWTSRNGDPRWAARGPHRVPS